MSKLRFKTCRLLFQNVWNRKPTKIQGRILQRLRKKNRSLKRNLYSRRNLNSYIESQTTRKLSLFHGNLPITEMHRRRKQSTIPFLLNLETRLDVILVRIHFRETLPQARQPISHRKVCVNNRMVNRTHFKVSHGDLISFQDNDARIRREKIRRSFYLSVGQKCSMTRRAHRGKGKKEKGKKGKGKKSFLEIKPEIKLEIKKILEILKNMDRPVRMGRRTKTKWFQQEGKTKEEDSLLPQNRFFPKWLKKEKRKNPRMLSLSSFAEKNIIKSFFLFLHNTRTPPLSTEKVDSHFSLNLLFLLLREIEEKRKKAKDFSLRRKEARDLLKKFPKNFPRTLFCNNQIPIYVSYSDEEIKPKREEDTLSESDFSSKKCTRNKKRNKKRKRQIKKIELPTHYSEVNHRTSKAVVSYRPNIGHIPHDIKMKDLNLLLRIGMWLKE